MRKFIDGPYAGQDIEIMPSKAATKLPDGSPIVGPFVRTYTNAQVEHVCGNIDVHEPQIFYIRDNGDWHHKHVGPSVAQEWKILAKGDRPFYRYEGTELL